MILVLDVGNTNIVLGVYNGETLVAHWRLSTKCHWTIDEFGILLKQLLSDRGFSSADMQAVVVSSVVPPLNTTIDQACRNYFGFTPLLVGPGVKTGMPIKYENPREVGADRIVNAIAAQEQYGVPLILVDFGTAITFCAVSVRGEYLGGIITPGIDISCEALFDRAAKLPRVELVCPPQVIGRNTVQSMQSGIIYGYAGLVDAIVRRMQAEIEGRPRVVATGGQAELIARESETIETIDQFLTLWGLRLIYERNRPANQVETRSEEL
jgi:type III pantothenate kinase